MPERKELSKRVVDEAWNRGHRKARPEPHHKTNFPSEFWDAHRR